MDKLTLSAYVENLQVKYYDAEYKDKLKKFKADNDFHAIEITFEVTDSVQHFQHKYYRGYVLPAICETSGERDTNRMHMILKSKYLITPVNGLDEIPAKHKSRAMIFCEKKLIDGKERQAAVAYIPSTATLSYKAMKEFIEKCEQLLFTELNGRIAEKPELEKEAMDIRHEAFKQNPVLAGEEVETEDWDDLHKLEELDA